MIRATGEINGQRVVFLGLEPTNIVRMARNEPIKVNLAHLDPEGEPTGLPDIDILIFDVHATPPADLRKLFQVDPEDE